jgi:hypothetical protein
MQLRKTVRPADSEFEFEVVIHCAANPRAQGKYIVGRAPASPDRVSVVFDDTAAFHKDLGEKYGVRPQGGGWCVLDRTARTLTLSSRSTQYGREPNRQATLAAFRAALPDYDCDEEG